MIFKSYIIEQNIKQILNCKSILFYGENEGLKKDFKDLLKNSLKNTKIIRISNSDLIKDKNILFGEILNKSLFEEKKIFFIEDVNDKFLDVFEEIKININDEKIFLFGNILDKKSKLRNFFEVSKDVGIVACYKDNELTIKNLIIKKLSDIKGLNGEIINLILYNTNLDRNKVNNEVQKIKSYLINNKIDFKSIENLLNIRINDDFTLLSDEALKGNKNKTNKLLADTVFNVEENVYYLNVLNLRMAKLNQIENLKKDGNTPESALSLVKPPIFWKDKPIILEQSKKWNSKKINEALKKIHNAEFKIKSNSDIRKDLLIKNLIVELCVSASAA